MASHQQLLCLLVGLANIAVSEAATKCPLPWNEDPALPDGLNTTAVCPYGHRLPGDVTFPNDPTFFERVYVVYGFIPYVVIALSALDAIVRAILNRGMGTREFSFLFFVCLQVGLGELVFKKMVNQARPDKSCNLTCGMPSSHSTMSIGFFTLLFFDAVYRVMPSAPLDVASARRYPAPGRSARECCTLQLRNAFNIVPMPNSHTMSRGDFIFFVGAWGLALLPVPFTRVMLFDHTLSQVAIGGLVGFLEAAVYWLIVRLVLMERWNYRLGTNIGYLFLHNLAKPLPDVMGKTFFLLAQAEECEETGDDTQLIQMQLAKQHTQLCWYEKELDPLFENLSTERDEATAEMRYDRIQELKEQINLKLAALNQRSGLGSDGEPLL